MESTAAVLAPGELVSRVRDTCDRCAKAAPKGFDSLHRDLRAFHSVLEAAQPLLVPGRSPEEILSGCDRVLCDIIELLSKHDSLSGPRKSVLLLHRLSWGSFRAEIKELRSRLSVQVGMLDMHLIATKPLAAEGSSAWHSDGAAKSGQASPSYGQEKELVCRSDQQPPLAADTPRLLSTAASRSTLAMHPPPVSTRHVPEKPCSGILSPPPEYATLPAMTANTSEIQNMSTGSPSPISIGYSEASSSNSVHSSASVAREQSAALRTIFSRDRSRLVAAAKGGDITTLSRLLNDEARRSHLGQTSINRALIAVSRCEKREREQTGAIKLLLDWGAELECKDDQFGRTPLIWAVTTGREDIATFLLRSNAVIEARDEVQDWTPLTWAVWWGNELIMHQLISRGASPTATDKLWKRTPLLWAARKGTYGAAKILLEINREVIEIQDKEGCTPLAVAYMQGHETVVAMLIRYKANTNFRFNSGLPLLISAIAGGYENVIRLLVDGGADVRCKSKDGMPALSVAVKAELPAVVELLINRGAPLEARDSRGRTALLWAVGRCREDIVELLLKRGANRSAEDSEGQTVRHWAGLTGNYRIIELVSKKG
ncbi:MAG: hypothetical protein M1840_005234 [Geoglossum simile]|nr:MAG: hypothetical protein M1840_005234 [Geoglossum simile]